MTRLGPDEQCSRCGGLLYPPELAPGMKVPPSADYVCLRCGRAYVWTGNPPSLRVVAPVPVEDEHEEEDDE